MTRFQHLTGVYNYAKAKPLALQRDQSVKVLVQVEGTPVAEAAADAEDAGKSFDKNAGRQTLRDRQKGVEQAITRLSGRIGAHYTDTFNGVAATVPLGRLSTLAASSGVTGVFPVRRYTRDNAAGGAYIGANKVWQDLGKTGKGVKVAVIDTGIDYTHADFGGSGNPADFSGNNGTIIEPGTFPTKKVVAGQDFVGDDYNADDPANSTPKPDPDPLDCNGHGSHVAGTAAGAGVTSDGKTYAGPYDANTYSKGFKVAPGVAPEATLMAYRVFGCEGSANDDVILAAMDQAAKDGANVVNMSLGSPFGRPDEPLAQAAQTLTRAGITLVASSGNSGQNAYMTGGPSAANSAIAVAAIDASAAGFPGARVTVDGTSVTAIDANLAPLPSGPLQVAVLRVSYPDGPVSLGCDPAEYARYPGGVTGKLVVSLRGTCARVARAIFAQQAGAAAALMINNAPGLPPQEGPITSNPDTGEPYNVTIPFLGVSSTDAPTVTGFDGKSAAIAAQDIPNPGYGQSASFTSAGPRVIDSAFKPDVSAPGVAVISAGVGTGTGPATISGTSMASPMTAGVATLIKQAHPTWRPSQIKAAIVSTADASRMGGYSPVVAGSGVVNARAAVGATAFASAPFDGGNLSFKYSPVQFGPYVGVQAITLTNKGTKPVTYDLAAAFTGDGRGASVHVLPRTVTVGPGSIGLAAATLTLSPSALAALPAAENSVFGALTEIQGVVTATPRGSAAGAFPLRLGFLLVPDAQSRVTAQRATPFRSSGGTLTTTVRVRNSGVHPGTADVYAAGPTDARDTPGQEGSADIVSAGVQILPGDVLGAGPDDRSVIFAINVAGRFSAPSSNQYEIALDVSGDGKADYFVDGQDLGSVLTGDDDGRFASVIYDAAGNLVDAWVATAPDNGGTMLLPALASEIGLTAANSKFTYSAASASRYPVGLTDETGSAAFDAFHPPVSTGVTLALNPGASGDLTLTADRAALAATPVNGWLVVTLDDPAGTEESDQVGLPRLP
ncbi:S8 family serine peptidase [Streptosporangiaceae bacterium NEAU-GS5]|nr:S8 family serine peptidase [Streptosporangiaceae bacterium NEAU-GS5]